MTTKRQLAAIMFTDISGYSAMMQADEEYARRIRHRHRSVFKETHANHGGTILQYFGDGTLSIFDSAAAAVECAVDMQIEYRKEPEVPLRIGIHTGDISYDDEGAYGDGLNIASRIEKLAIPGSVYISAKVFDDIKNHRWITAASIGRFQLRNIHNPLEIYVVTSKGVEVPTQEEVYDYPELLDNESRPKVAPGEGEMRSHRKKGVTVLLAFFLGWAGIHRFYLGQRKWGMFWLVAFVIALVMTTVSDAFMDFPPVAVFPLLGLLDAVLFAVTPKLDFNQKYNSSSPKAADTNPRRDRQRVASRTRTRNVQSRSRNATSNWGQRNSAPTRRPYKQAAYRPDKPYNPALAEGVSLYKSGQYRKAILAFEEAVEFDPDATAAYFNLACCYSVLEEPDYAFKFLSIAVETGFNDFVKLDNHEALSFLRSQEDYPSFVANGYRVVEKLPQPKSDLIDDLQQFNPEVLDKLELLGDQMERGELSQEEFESEKKKILGHDD